MYEVGTILKQTYVADNPYAEPKFRLWEVIAPSSASRDGRVRLVRPWANDRNEVGFESPATSAWLARSCTVHAEPSVAPPIGDGVMHAEIHYGPSLVSEHVHNGPADELFAEIVDVLSLFDDDGHTVHWWGYAPDDDGLPDMIATWTNNQLVWRDA